MPPPASITLRRPALPCPARSDWVRVGYSLYGGQIQGLAPDPKIKAAMQLRSSVLAVRQVKSGESVGYGGRWIAQRDSLIATLPIGYGDGYPWAAADGTPYQHQWADCAPRRTSLYGYDHRGRHGLRRRDDGRTRRIVGRSAPN